MNFTGFELLLEETMGLDTASLTPSSVARAIELRMKACDVSDPEDYRDLVRASKIEAQELIESVIVPETWFFRDQESFATLGRLAREEWLSVRPDDALRLLSLPCSSGEEPYSMAMTLFDAGLPPPRFSVDAIDISEISLERARDGNYGKNSFRGSDLHFRDRYFEEKSSKWYLAEKVRRQVHFERGNLIDAHLLAGRQRYDAIFCRNVLIYFSREAQEQVIQTLDRLLAPEGILFMGSSETSLLPPERFVPARLAHAFAFRKVDAGALRKKAVAAGKPSVRRRTVPTLAVAAPLPPARVKPMPVASPALRAPVPPSSMPPVDVLEQVMLLADQGKLGDAAELCEAHIRQEGASAQAYYSLGLIRDAGGRPGEAAELYRKALYLDPRNEEALAHLASLLKSQGDIEGARLLLNRARRLTPRERA